MADILELKNVGFSATEGRIIHGITTGFEVSKITAIIGPSGGGKSTVLKLAAGLLVPDQGEVLYKNKNIALMSNAENLEFRREGAFVFQDSALWANQNIEQILELPLRIHFPAMTRNERINRIKQVTLEVGYRKNLAIRPSRLSMGEQKLIGFARALLCKPTLLYLDEWVESLDEISGNRLIDIVKRKKWEGSTVIFVCHDMRIIKDLADFILIIKDGKVDAKIARDQINGNTQLDDLIKAEMCS